MKCAVIDIGSNSMRLAAYEADRKEFKTLFREKIMAGLAGYVVDERLSDQGIAEACEGLLKFREMLELLGIGNVSVFATASLRNIANTQQAVAEIHAATGFSVEVISGEEEALYGYRGAMCDTEMTDGIFVDIGGASTEVATFSCGRLLSARSFPIGSLELYRDCVKRILPGEGSLRKIEEAIERELSGLQPAPAELGGRRMVCVGGTARAALKLTRRMFDLPENCRGFTASQLSALTKTLCRADGEAIDLILKTEPERVHTIVPGLMLLRRISKSYVVEELVVSKYGVREGYLCQRIQTDL